MLHKFVKLQEEKNKNQSTSWRRRRNPVGVENETREKRCRIRNSEFQVCQTATEERELLLQSH